ncbi:MAG: permease [Desulfuromonas sp.]|nr:MAG: permease [Desulfuromonas sp.]
MKKQDSCGALQTRQKIPRPIIFLLVVLVIYCGAFLLEPERALVALEFSTKMLFRILPILAVVCGFMLLNNLLVRPSWVKNHVGRDSGIKGMAIAVLGGVLSMGPIYVWYEILRDLQGKGMRSGLVAAFLYARGVKPQLLPLMVLYFGWIYTVVLSFFLIFFSLIVGTLSERLGADTLKE